MTTCILVVRPARKQVRARNRMTSLGNTQIPLSHENCIRIARIGPRWHHFRWLSQLRATASGFIAGHKNCPGEIFAAREITTRPRKSNFTSRMETERSFVERIVLSNARIPFTYRSIFQAQVFLDDHPAFTYTRKQPKE